MKCAERLMEELTKDTPTPCSHLVRHLRQTQSLDGLLQVRLQEFSLAASRADTFLQARPPYACASRTAVVALSNSLKFIA
jgi:hypothetical protein